jgi:TonB-dependent SusC/RagA subfamily outer membrane receptor
VVGYGVQKKATLIGSVSQAKGDDLLKTGSVTTISQAIQGLMPGVVSIINTSRPGADKAQVLIRAIGTWYNTAPLYLVDGVERDINDVDPNEIESISVLKDAAVTAVYGVKGGNGVVIVTTKRGENKRPEIGLSANFGFKQPTMKREYADYITSMNMWNEAATNDKAWGSLIPESTIAAWQNAYDTGNYGPYNDYFPEVDWWDEMVKPWGYQQQYNLNIRGGADFVKYFASFGYLYDGDIFRTIKTELYDPSFWYKRYNWRVNLDFNLTKTTTLSVNLAGKQGNRNQPGFRSTNENADTLGDAYSNNFFSTIYQAARHQFPIRWTEGEYAGEYGVSYDGSGNLRADFDRGQKK